MVEGLILGDPTLIHAKDKDGYTPLHRACYNDHEHVVDVSLCALECFENLPSLRSPGESGRVEWLSNLDDGKNSRRVLLGKSLEKCHLED